MEDAYSYASSYNWSQTGSSSNNSAGAAYNDSSSFIVPPWFIPSASASDCICRFNEYPGWSILPTQEGNRGDSVSKSHSQAEKRRRDRINAQLSTLRKLIPKSDKMDKAALLGCVIDQVKDLKQKAREVTKAMIIPTELDEITVDYDTDKQLPTSDNLLIRASVSCDDQPELFAELIRVLKGLGLSIVNAEIASVGGRVKSILVLCHKGDKESSGSSSSSSSVSVGSIKQSLNLVLNRISSSSSMPSNYCIRSKRQRFFLPSH